MTLLKRGGSIHISKASSNQHVLALHQLEFPLWPFPPLTQHPNHSSFLSLSPCISLPIVPNFPPKLGYFGMWVGLSQNTIQFVIHRPLYFITYKLITKKYSMKPSLLTKITYPLLTTGFNSKYFYSHIMVVSSNNFSGITNSQTKLILLTQREHKPTKSKVLHFDSQVIQEDW